MPVRDGKGRPYHHGNAAYSGIPLWWDQRRWPLRNELEVYIDMERTMDVSRFVVAVIRTLTVKAW